MDDQFRMAAFEWLDKQISIHGGDVLPRVLLEQGFIFKDERITLLGPKGIWKPRVMEYPLSITTTQSGPYSDMHTPDGFLKYKYRGTDPNHPDNVGLRKLISLKKPLIYFYAIEKGRYLVTRPVYIINDNIRNLEFTVAVDDTESVKQVADRVEEEAEYYRRLYLTANIETRVHQRSFRERVLRAYQNQCALCKLKHIELLDAAHIIPDKEEKGDPVIQNGLALCKIHHAAFDNNFIGISPDYIIKVRPDVLRESDGPMLRHGIQSLNNSKLILPAKASNWPDRERLSIRYSAFLQAEYP